MSKKILLPTLLVLAFLSIAIEDFIVSSLATKKVIHYISPKYIITDIMLEDYKNNNGEKQQMAERELIKSALHAIQYLNWLDYIEYIDVTIYYERVLPNSNQQLVVALNMSKDIAILVIYDRSEDYYVYTTHIENLVPIEKIDFISLDDNEHRMLAIHQVLDERFGGFFYEKFVDIFFYIDNDFKRVWQKTLYYQEIFNERWLNINGNQLVWNKIEEDTMIDISILEPIKINTITTLKKYTAKSKDIPSEDAFTLMETRNFKNTYLWSPDFKSFILGELSASVFLVDSAVIKDLEATRNVFYGVSNDYLKLKTINGEIFYLPKKKFYNMIK